MHANNSRQDELYRILGYLQEQRAVDFSGYKPGTIQRRVELRLARTGMPDYAAYYRYLMEHQAETDLLLSTMTITVSHFFRNPPVFKLLRDQVLPGLAASSGKGGLRIWCAGCARGEEPYSIAILLREMFSEGAISMPVFIIATDIDRDALAYAARGSYQANDLAALGRDYRDRYFIGNNGCYRVREEIRSMVTFAWHDITTCRPPREGVFADYQLILCRNTLIYFKRALYERVLACLTGLLANKGCLVLGEAEMIPARMARNFREIASRSRIFIKEGIECSTGS